jgi:hypothetical protein
MNDDGAWKKDELEKRTGSVRRKSVRVKTEKIVVQKVIERRKIRSIKNRTNWKNMLEQIEKEKKLSWMEEIRDEGKKGMFVGGRGTVRRMNLDEDENWEKRWKKEEKRLKSMKGELQRQEELKEWKLDSVEKLDWEKELNKEENWMKRIGEEKREMEMVNLLERKRYREKESEFGDILQKIRMDEWRRSVEDWNCWKMNLWSKNSWNGWMENSVENTLQREIEKVQKEVLMLSKEKCESIEVQRMDRLAQGDKKDEE